MATATSLNEHAATTACRSARALVSGGTAFAAPTVGLVAGPLLGIHLQIPEGPGALWRGGNP